MSNILTCASTDAKFPKKLNMIADPPERIYYKGDIEIINRSKCVAIVGSRNCSQEGLKLAYQTAEIAVNKGFVVVNGLALGCDVEALKGALDQKGKCVAVMPCGLEQIQPKSNQYIADAILEKGGCIISEYAEETPLQKYNYVKRDRIQSGISDSVIIIEAQEKSGTMHTADFATRQGKRLACYAAALMKYSSGNKYLEEAKKVQALQSVKDAEKFLDYVIMEPGFEQISLKFE
ncbi:MAG: DNA-protecting protein DprA [Agathobacter sp.]|nr:DNA-protecting protein DprA [Agathobacter sp.]MBQ3558769.1 DNA-protecting protein DprA [Agathobacter sp.]